MASKSDWLRGLLYAEETIQHMGHIVAMRYWKDNGYLDNPFDFGDFERAILDYIRHYEEIPK